MKNTHFQKYLIVLSFLILGILISCEKGHKKQSNSSVQYKYEDIVDPPLFFKMENNFICTWGDTFKQKCTIKFRKYMGKVKLTTIEGTISPTKTDSIWQLAIPTNNYSLNHIKGDCICVPVELQLSYTPKKDTNTQREQAFTSSFYIHKMKK